MSPGSRRATLQQEGEQARARRARSSSRQQATLQERAHHRIPLVNLAHTRPTMLCIHVVYLELRCVHCT